MINQEVYDRLKESNIVAYDNETMNRLLSYVRSRTMELTEEYADEVYESVRRQLEQKKRQQEMDIILYGFYNYVNQLGRERVGMEGSMMSNTIEWLDFLIQLKVELMEEDISYQ